MAAVIHMGLGKCCSTLLQKKIFPLLIEPSRSIFEVSRSKSIASVSRALEAQQSSFGVLCSNESLIGWFPDEFDAAFKLLGNLELARNIHWFIVVRPPLSYLSSLYAQMLRQGYCLDLQSFESYVESTLVDDSFGFSALQNMPREVKITIIDMDQLLKCTPRKLAKILGIETSFSDDLDNEISEFPRVNSGFGQGSRLLSLLWKLKFFSRIPDPQRPNLFYAPASRSVLGRKLQQFIQFLEHNNLPVNFSEDFKCVIAGQEDGLRRQLLSYQIEI
jgi:hypothetical protein